MKKYPVTSQSGNKYLVKVINGEWSAHEVLVKKKWILGIYIIVWNHSVDNSLSDSIVEEAKIAVHSYEEHIKKKKRFRTIFEKWDGNIN